VPTTTQQEHRNTGSREGGSMPAPAYMSRDRVTCWLVGVAPAGSFWAFGEGMIAGAEAGRHEPSALSCMRERKGTRQQRTCVCVRCGGWVGMTGDKCAERGRRDTNRQGNRKSQSRHKLPTQWLANHEPPGALRIARVGSGHPHSTPTTLAAIAHIA
jgi:hypothetical protein